MLGFFHMMAFQSMSAPYTVMFSIKIISLITKCYKFNIFLRPYYKLKTKIKLRVSELCVIVKYNHGQDWFNIPIWSSEVCKVINGLITQSDYKLFYGSNKRKKAPSNIREPGISRRNIISFQKSEMTLIFCWYFIIFI